MELITPLLVIIGFGTLFFLLKQKQSGKDGEEVGRLRTELETEKSRRSEQEGKGKQLFAQFEQVKSELTSTVKEKERLQKEVTKFETERESRDREFQDRVMKLEAAEVSFKQEKARVIREDEERLARAEAERDRMWKEHENSVIAQLSDLCKQPQFAFTTFDNNNLPEGFDGSLKPDFMIEFLDQYIIFDAKVSKSKSLQTYIADAVKSTVTKVKRNPKIFPHIFLVVPSQAIHELKTFHYALDGYTLYVISPEAVSPILMSLKRITTYELADSLDPQQRENIVNLIAELDYHINLRNATDLFFTKLATNLLDRASHINPELSEEIELKKREMRSPFNHAEIKKLILSTTLQNAEIDQLASPQAAVKGAFVQSVKEEVIQKLL